MDKEQKELLMNKAAKARENSYAPYSGFRVGAALLMEDGAIVTGCNVENASYGLCNCAERTAFFKALSEGKKDFLAIAITGGLQEESEGVFPCGACRQVMREFCDPDSFRILVRGKDGAIEEYRLEELLPHSFGPGNLLQEGAL